MTEVPPPGDRRHPSAASAVPDPLRRLDARILDPATAVRAPDGQPPEPTIYRNNRVIANARDVEELHAITAAIDAVLVEMAAEPSVARAQPGFIRRHRDPLNPQPVRPAPIRPEPTQDERRERGEEVRVPGPEWEWQSQAARLQRAIENKNKPPLAAVIPLEPAQQDGRAEVAAPIDVYELVQRLHHHRDEKIRRVGQLVGLEHVLTCSAVGLAPFAGSLAPFAGSLAPFAGSLQSGIPFYRGISGGLLSYLAPGSGGRTPASLVFTLPVVAQDGPRVVVLDTGCDKNHTWFSGDQVTDRVVVKDANGDTVSVDGFDDTIGLDVERHKDSNPEGAACLPDPMTGAIPPAVGHGTFISGIVRQIEPTAQIVALRIADAYGAVAEGELVSAIADLISRQTEEPRWADVLLLSLGYYPESAEDALKNSALGAQLLKLAELGVTIIAAAGNDSTTTPFFPAAFAVDPRFDDEKNGSHLRVPLVSVAAENPDGTIALFSNDGDWVTAQAPGANVVSAFPVGLSGSWQSDVSVAGPRETSRSTLDPDGYSGGFGLWSGTSFAAPVLAGGYLRRLAQEFRSAAELAQPAVVDIEERRSLLKDICVRPDAGKQ